MRTGQNLQGSVRSVGVIEVKPHGEHPLEQLDGRLGVRNAFFRAPRAEAENLHPFAERQRQILVPWDQPVRPG